MAAAGQYPRFTHYVIVVEGQIDPYWADWFDGLAFKTLPESQTRLDACLGDQAALRGLLNQIFDLNLRLISLAIVA